MHSSKMLRHFPRWYDPRGRDQAGSAGRSAAFSNQSGRSQLHLRWPEPYPSQRTFFQMHGTTYKGLSGPVGTGKSKCLCYEGLKLALKNAGRVGLIGAPTYPMLRDVTRAAFLEMLEEEGLAYRFNKSDNQIILDCNQSQIIFRSLDNIERLRGTNLAWFGIDELTYCKEQAWLRLEARLRDPRASRRCGFAVWTPKGFDWVFRRFISPDEKHPDTVVVRAKPYENKAVLAADPSYYERLKHSYDERFYKQEVLGEYLDVFADRAYHAYDSEDHDKPLTFRPTDPICWAIDFNLDPMCAVLAQSIHGRLYVLDEIVVPNATIDAMCDRVAERLQLYLDQYRAHDAGSRLPVLLYGDATSNRTNTHTAKSDYDLIKLNFRRRPDFQLKDNVPSVNPPVKDRVSSVNWMLKNAAGEVRLFVDLRCKELRKDFLQVTVKQDSERFELDKKKDSRRTHVSDALGYLIWSEHRVDGFQRMNVY